jgi:XTP/dITP diphosphohydrolase
VSSKLVLATRNRAKLAELQRILNGAIDVELLGLDDLPTYDEVPESGATFEDNALLKAREAVRHTGLPAVADDSGLSVDALGGMPGVLSARWAGGHGDDEANLRLLLDQLRDVADERRGAAFLCAAALVLPDGGEVVAHGHVEGVVIREPRGDGGFGYDPVFVPHGETRTTAEMPAAEKDAISHRGKAFRAIASHVIAALS